MQPGATARIRPGSVPGDLRLQGLLAALVIHVAVLAPILFDMARSTVETPLIEPEAIPLDLTPVVLPRRESPPRTLSPGGSDLARAVRPVREADDRSPSPLASATSGPHIPDAATPPVAGTDLAESRNRRMADALRRSADCRNRVQSLSTAEQADCDRRYEARSQGPLIDPSHARFEAEGAARLAAYENLRAGLRPPGPETRLCPHRTDIMGRCPVQLSIPLYSSQGGVLPGLRKAD